MFGYIPEIPAPYDTLTVDEHLEFHRPRLSGAGLAGEGESPDGADGTGG